MSSDPQAILGTRPPSALWGKAGSADDDGARKTTQTRGAGGGGGKRRRDEADEGRPARRNARVSYAEDSD